MRGSSFPAVGACANCAGLWEAMGNGEASESSIIYWAKASDQILMLFVFPKPEREDLTPAQLRILKRIVDEEYR